MDTARFVNKIFKNQTGRSKLSRMISKLEEEEKFIPEFIAKRASNEFQEVNVSVISEWRSGDFTTTPVNKKSESNICNLYYKRKIKMFISRAVKYLAGLCLSLLNLLFIQGIRYSKSLRSRVRTDQIRML